MDLDDVGPSLKKQNDALLDRGESADKTVQSSSAVSDEPTLAKINCTANKPCPSCGVDTNLSRAATVLAHIGPSGTLKDFNSMKGMGSVRSHSILAQSVIRRITREMISHFMASNKLGDSACALIQPENWKEFAPAYHEHLLKAATAGIREDLTSHFEKMKRDALERKGTLDQLKKLEDAWKQEQRLLEEGKVIEIEDADYQKMKVADLLFQYTAEPLEAAAIANQLPIQKPEKGAIADVLLKTVMTPGEHIVTIQVKRDQEDIQKDLAAAREAEYVPVATTREVKLKILIKPPPITTGGTLNQEQFSRYRDFRSNPKFPKGQTEFSSRPLGEDQLLSKLKDLNKTDQDYTKALAGAKAEICATISGDLPDNFVIYREILDAKGNVLLVTQQAVVDGKREAEEVVRNASAAKTWKDTIFENLMMEPFLDESQCRYCEDLQKDFSLADRAHYAKKMGAPEAFVAKHLAAKLESVSPEEFTAKWLGKVVDKLYEKLSEQCSTEKKPEAPKKAAKAKLPDSVRDTAITEQLKAFASGEKVDVNKVAVALMKELGQQNYAVDAPSLKEAIRGQLNPDGTKK